MSRSHRLENGSPQHEIAKASNSTGSPTLSSWSGDNSGKIRPMPPQRKSGKLNSKRNTQLHDSRIHLEPLRPQSGTSSADRRTNAHFLVSPSSGQVHWDSTVLEPGSTISENMDKLQNVDRKLQFYKTLANLKLRDGTYSEQSLQKTLTSLLCAAATALDATAVVLYSLSSEKDPVVKVQACSISGPDIVGFQTSLETFALRGLVEQFEFNNKQTSTCSNEPVATYVACLRNLGTYEITCDVDLVLGLTTSSVLACVLPDEVGRPRFVMEARSIQDGLPFSKEFMHAALIAVENIVHPFELRRALSRNACTHSVVQEMVWYALDPSDHVSAVSQDTSNKDEGLIRDKFETSVSPEVKWMSSLDTKRLAAQIMTAAPMLSGFYLFELLNDSYQCKLLVTHEMGLDLDRNQCFCTEIESNKLLYQELVEAARSHKFLNLSDNASLNSALQIETNGKHLLTFLPVPTCRRSATLCGMLCLVPSSVEVLWATNKADLTLELQLQPILAAIALTLSNKQQSDDLIASTRQKQQLLALCRSHSLLESVRDPSSLVSLICDLGSVVFQTNHVTLYVSDTIKQELWSLSSWGSVNGLRIPYGRGIAGHVAVAKEPLIIQRPYEDPRFDRSVDAKFGFKTESLITQPILDRAGETIGVLQAINFGQFSGVSPFVACYDDEVMANYLQTVAHALHMNSSLIIFAKVKADQWAKRTLQESVYDDVAAKDESNHNSYHLETESETGLDAKHEVASVHSLLGMSGFDEGKCIIYRDKWSTFAYACWALGRFISSKPSVKARIQQRSQLGHEQSEKSMAEYAENNIPAQIFLRPRIRSRTASVVRARRTHSLITRWHRMTMGQEGFGNVEELLQDHFDPLTKSISELENYSYQLFEALVLIKTFRIDVVTLRMFIGELASRYRDVPYHNFYHGFDVALASYTLMRSPEVLSVIKELEALSLLIAALGHDADHPGNDNQFEVDSSSDLALCYNDISVLENHHAATTFAALKVPGCDILQSLSSSARASARMIIIRSILGTDMKHHTKLLSELTAVSSIHEFEAVPEGRQLMLTMIIHGADLHSIGRPLSLALKWVERVCTEFTQQATRSAESGLDVSPHLLNLEDEATRCRLQMNFIDYLVAPLWTSISNLIPAAKHTLDNLKLNRLYFSEQAMLLNAKHSG
ncbi:3 5-cyclic nucleotide [Plasmopara halstedii]|uniref:3 5-cyclic nucleotide n=1 Tax=Plasmopara halstedii TaxID=4781 RepID=A0A0P1ACS5_PLAHL|nr:3 5-cyclic nucleotide [Plasmopara halstedii]CEG38031.1 3 5-cyclic nucleotide [Plasmopara halstedii]|eukprot:XP_024574400.1 3 5-cyclic nucleotide [Plasmopara halstedii]